MLIEMLAAVAVVSSGPPVAQDGQMGPRVAPRGDYRDSCSGEYVNRGRLYADCRDDRGRIRGTSIELNRCTAHEIRNNDGLLVCGPNRGQFEDRPGGGGGGGDGGWPGNGDGWNGRGGIVVYRDDGFQGRFQTFDSAISDLRSWGMNDTISSMRMRGSWTACTDTNFRGQCQTFSGDVSSLRAAGMNDRISSLRPGRFDGGGNDGWGNSSITVFVDALYRGASETFSREIPDLRSSGFNDRISSMRVRGSWEVCTDAYFRGQCEIIREDAWNLQQRRLNDSISSMRPVGRGGHW